MWHGTSGSSIPSHTLHGSAFACQSWRVPKNQDPCTSLSPGRLEARSDGTQIKWPQRVHSDRCIMWRGVFIRGCIHFCEDRFFGEFRRDRTATHSVRIRSSFRIRSRHNARQRSSVSRNGRAVGDLAPFSCIHFEHDVAHGYSPVSIPAHLAPSGLGTLINRAE
jgi:hypothetical protein